MIKIIYMSNGYFGVPTLKYLIKKKKITINYIITSKKKYINNNLNLIKKIAQKNKIKIINSENINKKKNIKKIIKSKPDLQILISFKIIKKKIWKIPKLGTINIHPSLLPLYKGSNPINWVIINGEKYTGLTSFFINNNIDGGPIILQKKIKIKKNINFDNLFNKLSNLSKYFLIKTIKKIINKNYKCKTIINNTEYKLAPKINNFYTKIFFNFYKTKYIYNLILGLTKKKPSWCFLNTINNIYILNIYKINIKININLKNFTYLKPGEILYYKKKIFVKTINNFFELLICQLSNKKIMNIIDLYNGLKFKNKLFLF
ncbi:MAG: hypothetical protein NHG08_00710 [Candidatus Shikimatogenerans sp. JK-2022]|nr:hypothetical protein [Candidatus Shikimatogenerans bostrichidophilus]